jgi:hypothetical protein
MRRLVPLERAVIERAPVSLWVARLPQGGYRARESLQNAPSTRQTVGGDEGRVATRQLVGGLGCPPLLRLHCLRRVLRRAKPTYPPDTVYPPPFEPS